MMSVRTFFLACLSVVSTIALLASLVLLKTQWESWSRANDAGALASTLHHLLLASERTSLERGFVNVALLAEVPATDAASRQDLDSRRASLDAALAAAGTGLAGAPMLRRDEAVAALKRG
jgi:hypothetical protein